MQNQSLHSLDILKERNEMTKDAKIVLILLLIVIIIAVIPLLTITDCKFSGADGAAKDVIAVVNPDYVPWAKSILEPPGAETESLLFCMQAGIGAGIFGFGFGYLVAREKFQKGN